MSEARYCTRCGSVLASRLVDGRLRPACDRCGTTFFADPKVAVAGIVPWKGGILLGRRAIDPGSGRWSFPSGYVDRGEVVEEALTREVREEIGLAVAIERLVGVYSSAGEPVILIVFAVRVQEGVPVAGHEVSEIGVFQPDSLPDMAFAHDDIIVRDWLSGSFSATSTSAP